MRPSLNGEAYVSVCAYPNSAQSSPGARGLRPSAPPCLTMWRQDDDPTPRWVRRTGGGGGSARTPFPSAQRRVGVALEVQAMLRIRALRGHLHPHRLRDRSPIRSRDCSIATRTGSSLRRRFGKCATTAHSRYTLIRTLLRLLRVAVRALNRSSALSRTCSERVNRCSKSHKTRWLSACSA